MIIWKCPNPNCNINNVYQDDPNLILEDETEIIRTYDTQCSNCLKKYEIIINTRLKELKIKDKNG
ncbi:MAG: hypothetical protein JG777_1097 [Clostridia bacterium]|uniref:hypothetical protein n=1 Tax=Petroclostridium xylanilyticum TaxID=1792311 RepID=UPI000B99338A|nr:hypothetical protein [Petroclostridium xylanilyticum]MBZ4645608.1 hypothetical protein [Clostridia bacterium]